MILWLILFNVFIFLIWKIWSKSRLFNISISIQTSPPTHEEAFQIGKDWSFLHLPSLVNGTDGKLEPLPRWSVDEYVNYSSVMQCRHRLLLIMVESSPDNKDRRDFIRSTWGQETDTSRTLFIVGTSSSNLTNDAILNEIKEFRDVIKGDFNDVYKNLTIKTLVGLHVMNRCDFIYLLKVDDDVYVNTEVLVNNLLRVNRTRGKQLYLGKSGDVTVNRGLSTPWGLSLDDYPFTMLPPFNLGGGYILTSDVVKTVIDNYKYVPFFINEDVYVGYIIARSGLKPCHVAGFYQTVVNYKKLCDLNKMFTYHKRFTKYDTNDHRKLYIKSMKAIKQCSPNYHIIKSAIEECSKP